MNDLNDVTRRRLLQTAAGGLAFAAGTRSSFGAAAGVIQRQEATAPPLPGPYPRIERLAPELDDVVTGEVEIVAKNVMPSMEGPMWSKKDGGLLICNGPRRVLYKPGQPGVTTVKENVQGGGLTLDQQGRIVATGGGRIRREEPDGAVTTIVDNYKGVPLNGTNDLCIHTDGSIYFTDPSFTPKQLGFNGVYRVTPDGKQLDLLTDDAGFCNGIALSPDEKTLYVCSGVDLAVFAWNVLPNGLIDKASKRVAADVRGTGAPGRPDGFKVDSKGNIHTGGGGGQWIVSPAGKPLGIIVTEEFAINCAFGGDDWRTLYYVTRSSVVAVKLKIAGEPVPMKRF